VSSSDQIVSQDDSFAAKITSNALRTVTPYKFEFRCFTPSLAAVMEDLARSSNCFVVKVLIVNPSDIQLAPSPQIKFATVSDTVPPPDTSGLPAPTPSSGPGNRSRFGRGRGAGAPGRFLTGQPGRGPAPPPTGGGGAPGAAAVTVLSEQLLFVTLAVDMVEINGPPL
jgi:hypothetical protein